MVSIAYSCQRPYHRWNQILRMIQPSEFYAEKVMNVVKTVLCYLARIIYLPLYLTGRLIYAYTGSEKVIGVLAKRMKEKTSAELNLEYECICMRFPNCDAKENPEMYSTALQENNLYKNRYMDNLPNEATRWTNPNDPDFYINANRILPGAIATQGPKASTVYDFWKMVWSSGSSNIVMLTDLMEGNIEKCNQYWPITPGAGFKLSKDLVVVTKEIKQVKIATHDVMIRKILISFQERKRVVTQYHLLGWNDRNVVEPLTLSLFTKMVRKGMRSSEGPLIAHCSAGLGRAGTFLATYESSKRVEAGEGYPEMISDIVEEMRSKRSGVVQEPGQYELIHRAVF